MCSKIPFRVPIPSFQCGRIKFSLARWLLVLNLGLRVALELGVRLDLGLWLGLRWYIETKRPKWAVNWLLVGSHALNLGEAFLDLGKFLDDGRGSEEESLVPIVFLVSLFWIPGRGMARICQHPHNCSVYCRDLPSVEKHAATEVDTQIVVPLIIGLAQGTVGKNDCLGHHVIIWLIVGSSSEVDVVGGGVSTLCVEILKYNC